MSSASAVPVAIAPASDPAAWRLARFQQLAMMYEIRPDYAAKLRQLEGYEIVLLLDDSGSMSNIVAPAATANDPFARQRTRWDELHQYASIVTDVAATLDPTGIDLYFLNRAPMKGVTSSAQIQAAFQYPPAGYTPLTRALRQVLAEKEVVLREKKLLLIIATDGQPTDETGNVKLQEFLDCIRGRPRNCYLSMIACTDDKKSVEYMNKIDRLVPGVDVSDDYHSEREEILAVQGRSYTFSFGDYVTKTLLGPIDPAFDRLDESRIGVAGCCSIV